VCEAEKRDGYGKQRKEGGSSVSINARPETESERESEQPRRAKNMKGGAKHYHQHQETRNFQDFLFFKSDHKKKKHTVWSGTHPLHVFLFAIK
jgi:hypothetical protein